MLQISGFAAFFYTVFEKINNCRIFAQPILQTSIKTTSMRKAKLSIDSDKLQASAELLRALAHPLRMKILGFIDQNSMINVNKIYNTLKLEQSITSQHLRILRAVDLVETHREGKYIYYKINYDKLNQAVGAIDTFLQKSEDA
jgi:ArsR family transcriptional regulator